MAQLAHVIMKKLLVVISQASLPERLLSAPLSRLCVILMCQPQTVFAAL